MTNNVCKCINTNPDEASLYFENLGVFGTVEECNRFANKQNISLLKDREKLKQIEISINLYKQKQIEKLSNYINDNASKEIKTHIDENGELKITKRVQSTQKPATSSPLNIPEIQFMPEIAPTSMAIEQIDDNKEIKVFEDVSMIQDVKIDKLNIENKEEDVREVENVAVDLINVLKANTLFKSVNDTEKESTQFKDRN
jgi:hypothetical protein